MLNLIGLIFKASIKSQSRFYWTMFLVSVALQIALFTYVMPYGFWYALASTTVLSWICVGILNRWFNWDSYIEGLFTPAETRRNK